MVFGSIVRDSECVKPKRNGELVGTCIKDFVDPTLYGFYKLQPKMQALTVQLPLH